MDRERSAEEILEAGAHELKEWLDKLEALGDNPPGVLFDDMKDLSRDELEAMFMLSLLGMYGCILNTQVEVVEHQQ